MIASRRELLALLAASGVKLRAQGSAAVDLDRLLSLFDFEAEAQTNFRRGG
jgi:hypothetical protein